MGFVEDLHDLVEVLCNIDITKEEFKNFIQFIYREDWDTIKQKRNANSSNTKVGYTKVGCEDAVQLFIKNNLNNIVFDYEKPGRVKQSAGEEIKDYFTGSGQPFVYPPSGGEDDLQFTKRVDLYSNCKLLEIKLFHPQLGPWAHFDTQLTHLFNNKIQPNYTDYSTNYSKMNDALNPKNTGLQIMPFVNINGKKVITFILVGQMLYDIAKMLNFYKYGDAQNNNPFGSCEIYSILFFKPNMYKNFSNSYLSNLKHNISVILNSYITSNCDMIIKGKNDGKSVHGIELINPNDIKFWYENNGVFTAKSITPTQTSTPQRRHRVQQCIPVEFFCQGNEMFCILLQTIPPPQTLPAP